MTNTVAINLNNLQLHQESPSITSFYNLADQIKYVESNFELSFTPARQSQLTKTQLNLQMNDTDENTLSLEMSCEHKTLCKNGTLSIVSSREEVGTRWF